MQLGVKATIVGRNGDRLKSAAKELSDATGQECLPVSADVRNPDTLVEAVKQTIEKFGRIDFVICGPWYFPLLSLPLYVHISIWSVGTDLEFE
jgi:peroxisomal 2,4-dienoyl-CoA reductase